VLAYNKRDAVTDIKNQILSDYLTFRKDLIFMKYGNYYWEACDRLRTLLCGMPISQENIDWRSKIIGFIDKVEADSLKISGLEKNIKAYNQQRFRDRISKRHFNTLLMDTTNLLQSEGYFDILLGNSSSDFFDPSGNKRSGTEFKK